MFCPSEKTNNSPTKTRRLVTNMFICTCSPRSSSKHSVLAPAPLSPPAPPPTTTGKSSEPSRSARGAPAAAVALCREVCLAGIHGLAREYMLDSDVFSEDSSSYLPPAEESISARHRQLVVVDTIEAAPAVVAAARSPGAGAIFDARARLYSSQSSAPSSAALLSLEWTGFLESMSRGDTGPADPFVLARFEACAPEPACTSCSLRG